MALESKQKIAFYSNPSSLGGSEVYLKSLIEHAVSENFEVLFFCNAQNPLRTFSEELGCEIVLLPESISQAAFTTEKTKDNSPELDSKENRPPYNLSVKDKVKSIVLKYIPKTFKFFIGTHKEIGLLTEFFLNYHADLFFFNDTGCEAPVVAARKAGKSPITGTLHVLPSGEKQNTTWVHRWLERKSLLSMDSIISVSHATKAAWLCRTKIDAGLIHVIHNGVDISKSDVNVNIDEKKTALRVNVGDILVGVPARLHPIKGHQYLFKALPNVISKIPNIKVLLIGDGALRNNLENLALQLGINKHVCFLGHRSDVAEVLRVVDFAILPSIMEAFGIAAIEVMAAKKALIATNCGGLPEIIDDGKIGLLIPVKDIDAIEQSLIKLAENNELRQRMGQAAQEKAFHFFTLEKMLEKTFIHLRKVSADLN